MARLRIFLDSNVVLDFLGRRDPFYEEARKLMILGKVGEFDLWISPSQVTDILYVLSSGGKKSAMPAAMKSLRGLRTFVDVASVGSQDIDKMLCTDWLDPEDALVHESALSVNADVLVTRNSRDFEDADIPVMDCGKLFEWLQADFGLTYDEIDL